MIRDSSVEQMKRLTIGVELAAKPSVLFLDGPTSGLDARSAKLIMDGVRKVADSGRTAPLCGRVLARAGLQPLLNIALALIIGLTSVHTDYATFQGMNAGVGMAFAAAVFAGVVSFNSCMVVVAEARNVFHHGRAAETQRRRLPRLRDTPATLPRGLTAAQYIDQVFEIRRDELWQNAAVIIGCIVLFPVLALLALRFINHQKK